MSSNDGDARDPVERLAAEFVARARDGAAPTIEAFAAEHPEHAERIHSLFPVLLAIESEVPPDPLASRARVGPYEVERELGRGGAGVVYLARDTRLARRVALKVLAQGPVPSAEALARFRSEAESASRVEHRGLCPVYDVGEAGGRAYIAFRLLAGETLARRVRRLRRAAEPDAPVVPADPTEVRAVLGIVEDAARALQAAHEAGLVHRDVKPANVMVTPHGEGMVLDFGLARTVDLGATAGSRTDTGAGTPAYMAPEQLTRPGSALDARVDVYGLGATLYEALTHRPPFEAPTLAALLGAVAKQEPTRVRRLAPTVSRDVEAIVETAMAKEPERRYTSALALAEDLAAARQGRPVRARPAGPVGRLRRWTRRNPAVAGSVAAAFLVLTAGLALSLVLLADTRRANDAEREARRTARAEALAAVSAEEGRRDAMLGLLLAREAVRASATPDTVGRLQAALEQSLERRRLPPRARPVVSLCLDARGEVVLEGCDDGSFVRHEVRGGSAVSVERAGAPAAPARDAALLGEGALPLVVDAAGVARVFGGDGRLRATLFGGSPVRAIDARSRAVGILALLEDGRVMRAAADDPARATVVVVTSEVDGRAARAEAVRALWGEHGFLVALSDATVVTFGADGTPGARRREAVATGTGPVVLLDDAFARFTPGPEVEALNVPFGTIAGTWRVWSRSGRPLRDLPTTTADPASPPPPWSAEGIRGVVGVDGTVVLDAAAYATATLDTPREMRVERVVLPRNGSRLLVVRGMASRDLGESADAAPLSLWTPLGNRVAAVRLAGGPSTAAAFSADGTLLAVGFARAPTAVCATAPAGLFGEAIGSKSARMRNRRHPALTEDGRRLLFEEEDAVLSTVDLDGGGRTRVALPPALARASVFAATAGKERIAVTASGGAVVVFADDGATLASWDEGGPVDGITWLRGDDRVVTSLRGAKEVELRDERGDSYMRTSGGRARWRRPDGTLLAERAGRVVDPPAASAFRPDRVVVQRDDGLLEIDDREGRVVTTLNAPEGYRPTGAEFSVDSTRLLLRMRSEAPGPPLLGKACLYDATTGASLAETPMVVSSWGVMAALGPGGSLHVVARPDGTTVFVDDRGRVRGDVGARAGAAPFSLAFDLRGERLAIGYEDGSLDVREVAGRSVFSLAPREGGIYAAFTLDGGGLVTWTDRGFVASWSLDARETAGLADERAVRSLTTAERDRYRHLLEPGR